MKELNNKIFRFVLVFLLVIFNQPFISCATSFADSDQDTTFDKKAYSKIKIRHGIEAEDKFYKGDYNGAAFIFEALSQKKDRNYALWNNQLGSIYLAAGEYEKAQDAFLRAHYLMNDVSAFRELESGAVSLFGSEAKKAYKGDPYEKLFNSLYVALLLDREDDLDNSLAALKNGILCDSDIQADLYRSDAFALYLLASRITLLQGNKPLSKQYLNEAIDAYRMTFPTNRMVVFKEQAQTFLLKEKMEELDKLKGTKKRSRKSKKTLSKIEKLESTIDKINDNIKTLEAEREGNNASIDVSMLKDFSDLKNNTLLCIELGRSPLKYQIGQYGEYALFASKPSEIKKIKVLIDGQELVSDIFLLNNDVYFQAITRGGRKMDSILKGQAQFKQSSAEMSMAFSRASQSMMNTARQQQTMNPYYDPTGAFMAAGIMSLISIGTAIASAAANPAADVRHWSLMPGNIIIVPLSLTPGTHNINVECYDSKDKLLHKSNSEVSVKVKEKGDNIIFKRFL